jgi:biotin carboxyl carrier protein
MLKITVNEGIRMDAEKTADGLLLNGERFAPDLVRISDNRFHVIHGNQSYEAEVVQANPAAKSFTFKINGTLYQVVVRDRFDQLLEQMGMAHGSAGLVKDLKAPMPGLILSVAVAVGQEVKKGDPLLILEAMKMENVIKAPVDATVKAIKVRKGDSVDKNQVLLLF